MLPDYLKVALLVRILMGSFSGSGSGGGEIDPSEIAYIPEAIDDMVEAGLLDLEPVVEEVEITDSWDTIISKINDGSYKIAYKIGNYKPLVLESGRTINMQIVAIDADDLADGTGKAKITWNSKEILDQQKMNPDERDGINWEDSEVRSYLKNTIKPLIPANIRNAIVPVTKKQEFSHTIRTSTEDVWIPSIYEIVGASLDGNLDFEEAGAVKYDTFYKDANSRIKRNYTDNRPGEWWTRSCGITNYTIEPYGTHPYSVMADTPYGVVLCFCT